MRRNDFFKYLLFSGGNPASRSELETETLPYTFNSNSYKLRSYRIYGNTVNEESVGDLVTEGEHSGEYLVPVTVEGKNLAHNIYKVGSTTIYDKVLYFDAELEPNTTYTLSLVMRNENDVYLNEALFNYKHLVGNGQRQFITVTTVTNLSKENSTQYSNGRWIILKNTINQPSTNTFLDIQLEKGTTATPYESYQASVTTNIYLTEQIKMVGDEAEYVDYEEQKQYFADGTSIDVTLPALLTFPGTNTLSVGTTVQPSKVYLQGKISETETVSARSLQTNMQSLQPLSLDNDDLQLDVMPSDDLQLDIMPIESDLQLDVIIPTANLNRIEDDEDAE